MVWNQSNGDHKREQDPWSGRGKEQGPPDLTELLGRLQKKLNQLRSGGANNKNRSNGNKNSPIDSNNIKSMGSVIAGVLFVIWMLSGIYIVAPAERSVILRLGQYSKTVGSGPHWLPRFIDAEYRVNVEKVENYPYQAEMLTSDENIISVEIAVQYRINDPQQYLFNVINPTESLQQATASALRQVIGQTRLEAALTSGRGLVRENVEKILKATLDSYKVGLEIVDVALQGIKPPEAVTEAFDDAVKAREDEERFKLEAASYANRIIPAAKGQAARLLEEANAYEQKVILQARGDIEKFSAILPEYTRAKQVLRDRMYIDAMETIFSKTNKIWLDIDKNNGVFYLPVDKMLAAQQEMIEENATAAEPKTVVINNNNGANNKVAGTSTVRPSRGMVFDRSNLIRQGERS